MRIIRYLKNKKRNLGILKGNKIFNINGNIFSSYSIGRKIDVLSQVQLLSPIKPPNIIGIGMNYQKHVKEVKGRIPKKPVIFLKATSSLVNPNSEIKLPANAHQKVDYEAELAVIIKKKAKNIETSKIDDYILGYTCANDISARDCQLDLDEQWARGKSFDTFCPLGPWIETNLNPMKCSIKSILNNKIMQNSNTSDMIFNVKELVSYLSYNMSLLPGTVILTGTPEGVGIGREKPVFLKKDDTIIVEIEGIGKLENEVSKE
jgi:2-keto-4-pentenoate hydratase/2-oxohepta-3-ene-1,7-dioic acid hydratase in catechol pathway